MRTTINIDDKLFAEAVKATGIKGKTELLSAGLQSLVRAAAMQRLIALGGTMPDFEAAPRHRGTSASRTVRGKRSRRAA